jgi:hypothetical protein
MEKDLKDREEQARTAKETADKAAASAEAERVRAEAATKEEESKNSLKNPAGAISKIKDSVQEKL